MRPTDFSKYLSDFLIRYMAHERGASSNTVATYRDAFVLLILFMEKQKRIKVHKMTLEMLTKEVIVEFLDWVQQERNCCDTTRNARLAAIHSFFRYMQYRCPENLYAYQQILSIKMKRAKAGAMNYLTVEGIKLLLQCPDTRTDAGRRDLALLSLMYDTAARVQEVIDLTPAMVRLEHPFTVQLIGKGKKARIVPMLEQQVRLLMDYMREYQLLKPHAGRYPLFCNNRKERLTRAGVNYILQKYAKMAREKDMGLIPEKISCHTIRHSKAMHLLQAGVNLVYIRDILGHVSVQTTEIYARADSYQKRKALENAYSDVRPKERSVWLSNDNLLKWLQSL